MKIPTLFALLFFIIHCSFSQTSEKIVCPDAIPESETVSVETIAAFINKHHTTEKEKITAIFCWLGHNITYDIAKATALSTSITDNYDKNKAIRHTLTVKKGVCQDYAELMETLCKKCDIKAYPIYGIVRKQEQIGEAHAWIIAWIERQWHIYDPTWGAGYVNDGVFTQHFNPDFYDIPPQKAIKSHLPLDPMWQLLQNPVSVEDFYLGDFQKKTSNPLFHFSDTIALFEQQDTIEQCYNVIRRIKTNGVYNQATVDYLTYLNTFIENDKVRVFNAGVYAFNDAVAALNEYSNYYNRQFTPEKNKEEVVQMLLTAESKMKTAIQCFQNIKNPSPEMIRSINDISSNMNIMSQQLSEHKKFVEKYFNTATALKKTLFYR